MGHEISGPFYHTFCYKRGEDYRLFYWTYWGLRFQTGAPNDNFRKIICSEDDLRSRIFGKISCLPASPRIFEHQKNGIIAHF